MNEDLKHKAINLLKELGYCISYHIYLRLSILGTHYF